MVHWWNSPFLPCSLLHTCTHAHTHECVYIKSLHQYIAYWKISRICFATYELFSAAVGLVYFFIWLVLFCYPFYVSIFISSLFPPSPLLMFPIYQSNSFLRFGATAAFWAEEAWPHSGFKVQQTCINTGFRSCCLCYISWNIMFGSCLSDYQGEGPTLFTSAEYW